MLINVENFVATNRMLIDLYRCTDTDKMKKTYTFADLYPMHNKPYLSEFDILGRSQVVLECELVTS